MEELMKEVKKGVKDVVTKEVVSWKDTTSLFFKRESLVLKFDERNSNMV